MRYLRYLVGFGCSLGYQTPQYQIFIVCITIFYGVLYPNILRDFPTESRKMDETIMGFSENGGYHQMAQPNGTYDVEHSDKPPQFVVHICTLCSDIPSWIKHAEYKHAISVQNPISSLHRNSHDGWYWFVYPWRHQSLDHGRSGPTSYRHFVPL